MNTVWAQAGLSSVASSLPRRARRSRSLFIPRGEARGAGNPKAQKLGEPTVI